MIGEKPRVPTYPLLHMREDELMGHVGDAGSSLRARLSRAVVGHQFRDVLGERAFAARAEERDQQGGSGE